MYQLFFCKVGFASHGKNSENTIKIGRQSMELQVVLQKAKLPPCPRQGISSYLWRSKAMTLSVTVETWTARPWA